jgi:hypothetical protein
MFKSLQPKFVDQKRLTTDFTDEHGWEKSAFILSVPIREIRGQSFIPD